MEGEEARAGGGGMTKHSRDRTQLQVWPWTGPGYLSTAAQQLYWVSAVLESHCTRRRTNAVGHSGESWERIQNTMQAEFSLLGTTEHGWNHCRMDVKSPLACFCFAYNLLLIIQKLIMQSTECLCSQALWYLLSRYLPACCSYQKTEVSERRHPILISLLSHSLASMEKSLLNVSYLPIKDLDIWGLFMDFITHFIPFTTTVNRWGLPISITLFQICRGVLCFEELNMLVHHIYPWQTIPGYRIQNNARNASVGLEGRMGGKF